jgi:RHS repeat-associated protein
VEESDGTLIAAYYYDPFGRRLWKEAGGVKTYFLYADEGLIGEYDASGAEIKTYGYKPGSTWTTDPLFMKEGNNYYFYHNDHLGTPQKITAVNGAVIWSATYTSFGEATVDAFSTITNNLRFPGQYYDQETGLHYNWHRFYDPGTGRYLRADPIGLAGGINLFSYTENKPSIWIDPYGLIWVTINYDYQYDKPKNWFNLILNRVCSLIGSGMEKGLRPKDFKRWKRNVIQEWQIDYDCENAHDYRHRLGARRRITQTREDIPIPGPGEVVIRPPDDYYWKPPVPTPTYKEFPGAKIEGDFPAGDFPKPGPNRSA